MGSDGNGTIPVVGVVGLGDMGGAIAGCLCAAGADVVAYDLRSDAVDRAVAAGAEAAPSLEALARRVDVVCIVVLDDAQVRAVVGDLLPVTGPGTTLVVHSTVQPATVREQAALAAERGIDLIDAAVSGGSEKGSLGTLTVMVGGPEAAVARCRPVFEAVGSHVFHVGPTGAGAAVKLVNNLLSLGTYALQLEAMQLAAVHGIDEDAVASVVTVSQGDSRGIRTWGRMDRIRRDRLRAGDATAVYRNVGKDLRTAATVAGTEGLTLPLTVTLAALLPGKMVERDALLDGRGSDPEPPRCATCSQELAAPYRAAGRHPECG